ncbi:MAG: DUF1549 domain-containing protein [Verrucomicrobiia bacterium]
MKTSRSFSLTALLLATLCFSIAAGAAVKDTSAQSKEIDKLVNKLLGEQKIKANGPISDEQFVRRIYLAAAGRIPTSAEAKAFLQNKDANKRDKLVDQLLDSEGYVSHFYNYWADILRINTRLGRSGASNEYAYKHWVKDALRKNLPYDKMVYELVSAEGNVWENGATGYYHRDRGMPLDNMANTVRVFLGTRLECAQCHDHPFDKWSQKEFFEMASFTYGVRTGYSGGENRAMITKTMRDERKQRTIKISQKITGIKGFYPTRRDSDITKIYASDDRRSVAKRRGIATEEEYRALNNKVQAALKKSEGAYGNINRLISDIYNPLRYASMNVRDRNAPLPHDYQYDDAKPKQLIEPGSMFGEDVHKDALENGYLPAYANWMTSKTNPRFTRVIANRLWKKAFGVGLVEPVDQFTDYSKPHNPELMDRLEQVMKDLDYDMKSFLAMLYKSKAWQRQAHTEDIGPGAPFYFPGPAMSRMSAEQIWDSLAALTIPDVDHYQPTLARELVAIDKERKIYEALESHSPEEFKAVVDGLSVEVKASYAWQQIVREKYTQARQAEDAELIRKYRDESRKLSGDLRRKISQVAYQGADGRTRDASALMASAGIMEMSVGNRMGGESYIRSTLPKVKLEAPEGMSKVEAKAWQRKQKSAASTWGRTARAVMRASELPTPAPRGHFLREFGQSDRELIENASESASVPQALSLMNSKMADILRHPYSVLGQALVKCETPREEIQTLYQHMFTRQPSKRETDRLLREYESDPKNARDNVIWALLNTQQFIFSL